MRRGADIFGGRYSRRCISCRPSKRFYGSTQGRSVQPVWSRFLRPQSDQPADRGSFPLSTRISRNSSGPLRSRRFRLAVSSTGAAASTRPSIVFAASCLALSALFAEIGPADLLRANPSSTSWRNASERLALFVIAHASTSAISVEGIRAVTWRSLVEGRPPLFGSTLINFFIFQLCLFYWIAVNLRHQKSGS